MSNRDEACTVIFLDLDGDGRGRRETSEVDGGGAMGCGGEFVTVLFVSTVEEKKLVLHNNVRVGSGFIDTRTGGVFGF